MWVPAGPTPPPSLASSKGPIWGGPGPWQPWQPLCQRLYGKGLETPILSDFVRLFLFHVGGVPRWKNISTHSNMHLPACLFPMARVCPPRTPRKMGILLQDRGGMQPGIGKAGCRVWRPGSNSLQGKKAVRHTHMPGTQCDGRARGMNILWDLKSLGSATLRAMADLKHGRHRGAILRLLWDDYHVVGCRLKYDYIMWLQMLEGSSIDIWLELCIMDTVSLTSLGLHFIINKMEARIVLLLNSGSQRPSCSFGTK